MIRSHRKAIGLMTSADPAFLAGRFATAGPEAGPEGERGTFLYFRGGYWDIRFDGGGALQLTPYGSRTVWADGSAQNGPAMTTPPRRPPWSLVLPRHSPFLGREDDDWHPDPLWPVTGDDGSWIVPVAGIRMPLYKGTLAVDTAMGVITRADLGTIVQTLTIDRTEPNDDDLAALELLKSTVKHRPGNGEPERRFRTHGVNDNPNI